MLDPRESGHIILLPDPESRPVLAYSQQYPESRVTSFELARSCQEDRSIAFPLCRFGHYAALLMMSPSEDLEAEPPVDD